jgi:hypothetical protein
VDRRAAAGVSGGPVPVGRATIFTEVASLDTLLDAHAAELGRDFAAYRNHTYRVLNLCVTFADEEAGSLEKIAVAAAFHDLGIWTDGTFDYLQPSARLAIAHLTNAGRDSWIPEVTGMILEHHKVTRYQRGTHSLVEPFRRADWVDVSLGCLRFGVSRALVRELFSIWPSAGFHRRLAELSWRRLRTHPLHPLPMLRF